MFLKGESLICFNKQEDAELQPAHMSSNRRMNHENVAYVHNEIDSVVRKNKILKMKFYIKCGDPGSERWKSHILMHSSRTILFVCMIQEVGDYSDQDRERSHVTGHGKEVESKVTKEEVGRKWRRNKFCLKKKI